MSPHSLRCCLQSQTGILHRLICPINYNNYSILTVLSGPPLCVRRGKSRRPFSRPCEIHREWSIRSTLLLDELSGLHAKDIRGLSKPGRLQHALSRVDFNSLLDSAYGACCPLYLPTFKTTMPPSFSRALMHDLGNTFSSTSTMTHRNTKNAVLTTLWPVCKHK